jgi:transcriptional regulator with XRE-family HTH domain
MPAKKVSALKRDVGRVVREIRVAKGLTIEELAERSKLSSKHVRSIELAKSEAGLEVLGKIARGLDVPITDLFVRVARAARSQVYLITESQMDAACATGREFERIRTRALQRDARSRRSR